jgi:hypothetical protein
MYENISNSFNIPLIGYTFLFVSLGVAFFYFKMRRASEVIPRRIVVSESYDEPEINEEPIGDVLNLQFLYQNVRKNFDINRFISINTFIGERLVREFQIDDAESISLFFRGTRLDRNKKFSDYENIRNNVIIHCFTLNQNRQQEHENYNEEVIDNRVVTIHSLIIHFAFFLFFMLIFGICKYDKEYLEGLPKLLLSILCILWLIRFSKVLATLLLFKRINYNL